MDSPLALNVFARVLMCIFYFIMLSSIEGAWKFYPVFMLVVHAWELSKTIVHKKEDKKDS
jgi:hypothetical protein